MNFDQDVLTLVINLDGSDARLSAVQPQLDAAGLNWQRLSAVDGRPGHGPGFELYENAPCLIRHDRPMTGGEIGCFLSHRKALQTFLATDKPYAIILEDDVIVPQNFKSDAHALITTLDGYAPETWETVHLTLNTRGYLRPATPFAGTQLYHSYFIPCGTPAILWSRRGAQGFLNSRFGSRIQGMVDRELRSYAARRGRSYMVSPWICDRRDGESDIDDGANRWANMPSGGRTTLRCKVRRHFPDYLNATISKLLRRG